MGSQLNSKEIVIGVLLGGLLGGASYALLTTKKGRRLQRKAAGTFEDLRDKVEEYIQCISNKTEDVLSCAKGQGDTWSEKANDVLELVKDHIETVTGPEGRDLRQGILIGALIGGALGVGSSLLMSNTEKNGDFAQVISDKAAKLKDIIQNVLDATAEHPKKTYNAAKGDSLNEVLKLAMSGMQLWKSMKR